MEPLNPSTSVLPLNSSENQQQTQLQGRTYSSKPRSFIPPSLSKKLQDARASDWENESESQCNSNDSPQNNKEQIEIDQHFRQQRAHFYRPLKIEK